MINETKVIKTAEQYHSYLAQIQKYMSKSTPLSQDEAEKLELLTVLLEVYENTKYPIEAQDPIDAISFRMAEKNLKQADLIQFFGTSSRVSEILNRKRPLTVPMIKALSIGLGISAETLLGLNALKNESSKVNNVDWSKFPIKEIEKRGWFESLSKVTKNSVEDVVKNFLAEAGLEFGAASFRRTFSGEANSPTTKYALYAWLARVILKARNKKSSIGVFDKSLLSANFLKEVAQLSWFDEGPRLAVEYLERHGIAVVFEKHLKGTLLDGAALKDIDGTPIIGLTLRHDRLDNFWFTLVHELAHVWKHIDDNTAFLDDTDSSSDDRREIEANRLTKEAFIPRLKWKRSEVRSTPTNESINKLSRELRIHPAVIAGRLRRETSNYVIFNDLIGHGSLGTLFFQTPDSNTEV